MNGAQPPREAVEILSVRQLGKVYGTAANRTEAVSSVDLSIREGEFVSVVGPSGAGKTTLLKCIAGLLAPTTGESRIRGEIITSPPPDLAVVFQDYSRSLFPWLTVRKNVALPLHKKSRQERTRLVERALEAVGLARFANYYPWQLSGGMQQRVAIARGLAYEPRILMMDEPFASVDAQTRAELEDLVLRLRPSFGVTLLLVTHDIDEAVYMSDRVVILTPAPSRVKEELTVELPYPRDQVETKEMAAFAQLRGHVYRSVTSRGAPVVGAGQASE